MGKIRGIVKTAKGLKGNLPPGTPRSLLHAARHHELLIALQLSCGEQLARNPNISYRLKIRINRSYC